MLVGAERPATLGGMTPYVGRIDPGRIDHGADPPAPFEIKWSNYTAKEQQESRNTVDEQMI